nr:hypothetical protein [Clostridia bacterium]
ASITTKDDKDLPVLSIYNDTTVKALEWADKIQNDTNMALLAERVKGKYSHVYDECINKVFGDGLSLFWMGAMKVVEVLRDYDVDYGVLPTPKLSETQNEYYCSYANVNLTAYSVPITNTDLERTSILTEAMAALSGKYLTPAYYDITLKGKALRDETSEEMLDLILQSRHYDMGANSNWGGIFNTLTKDKGIENFTSQYASLEVKAQAEIDSFIASLE